MLNHIFLTFILLTVVSCASGINYSGQHGGQLYSEGNISVEIVEKTNQTLDLYFYKKNKLIPASKLALKNGSIENLTSNAQDKSVTFKKVKDHFSATPGMNLDDAQALLNFQMTEGKTTHKFVIPL